MRLHRFYISEKIGDQKSLTIESAELANQIFRVFRLKAGNSGKAGGASTAGDKVVLFDGSGFDYECELGSDGAAQSKTQKSGNDRKTVICAIIEKRPSRYVPVKPLYLCAAITKKDTFEWIVQKATELGVTHIVPVIAERTEKKMLNEERLQKIAIEASEQSGRGDVPQILPITMLKDVFAILPTKQNIVFHTEGKPLGTFNILKNEGLALFIGPEGGWSPAEMELFHKNETTIVCLGSQVLRAETAVVAALSLVVFG